MGYDEVNINLGCPSKKVQKNKFGACLIKEPDLVAECINSMVNACRIPVTAKTRIGSVSYTHLTLPTSDLV